MPGRAEVPGHVLRIGVLTDETGPTADNAGAGSVVAARMAAEDAAELLSQISIEVIDADHQNKPDVASAIAREWVQSKGVNVVADVPLSSAALAVNEALRGAPRAVFIASGPGSSDLTGTKCSPNTIQWTYDTWALANAIARAMIQEGAKTWFFVTADYAFGYSLEKDATSFVKALGGAVLGSVRHPVFGSDFSSYLLAAQSSGADVIAFANATGDTINSIKQAHEFGMGQGKQRLAALLMMIEDVQALGLETAQGLYLTEPFYWDLNAGTRAFSERFAARDGGKRPSMIQAGVYAGLMHYFKAVHATGSTDAQTVMSAMKATPTDDPLFGHGSVRPDGRALHDMYLFRVKTPSESKGPWDDYNLVRSIPQQEAFRPLDQGGCPLVGK
ncbi:MAG: ABC transporter substrate-binding protein [Acetobacteraceae bacterium]|nr:ABC transporter substrate-binding protein [Acetobacteraceae bacterium]